MYYSPVSVHRTAYIENLKTLTDDEVLELFYTCLKWINYFQDADTHSIYRKIYQDVHNEVKRRRLRYSWSRKEAKKYRILAQKMYYGAMSFNDLEWSLGCIIMYSLPACRNIVKDKMPLVRETIQIIIECIHEHRRRSPLEDHRDVLAALDVPFFSYETLGIMYRLLKIMLMMGETFLIFFAFLFYTVLTVFRPIWDSLLPDHRCLRNILLFVEVFVTMFCIVHYLYFGNDVVELLMLLKA